MQPKNSKLYIQVKGSKRIPTSYTDDMSATTILKYKLDSIMDTLISHGQYVRYKYNASKCALLAHGIRDWQENSKFCTFKAGDAKVEKTRRIHTWLLHFNNLALSKLVHILIALPSPPE